MTFTDVNQSHTEMNSLEALRKTRVSHKQKDSSFVERFRSRWYVVKDVNVYGIHDQNKTTEDVALLISETLKAHGLDYAERVTGDTLSFFGTRKGLWYLSFVVGAELEAIVKDNRGYQWPWLYTCDGTIITSPEQLFQRELSILNKCRVRALICLKLLPIYLPLDVIKLIIGFVR